MVYTGRRAMVLGATGFIGRWVAAELARVGADLILPCRHPQAYQNSGWATVVGCDLSRAGAGAECIRRHRPSIVFNLAGYGVDRSEREEPLAWRLNAELPGELAQACQEAADPSWPGLTLVHAGSALEYGSAGGHLDEDSGTERPTEFYGRTKLEGTRSIRQATVSGGLRAVTARLFTVYGPGELEGRLLPSLLAARRTGAHLALTSGAQQRDFTYVEDVAQGLLRLGTGKSVQPVVNLATGVLTTVRQFVEQAAEILGLRREQLGFGELPSRAEEMDHLPVSLNNLLKATDWKPQTGIQEGVLATSRLTADLAMKNEGVLA